MVINILYLVSCGLKYSAVKARLSWDNNNNILITYFNICLLLTVSVADATRAGCPSAGETYN